jgi:hypothetical protein
MCESVPAEETILTDVPTNWDVRDLEEAEDILSADFPCPSYYQA